jgi:FkbM family methyltransferase
MALRRAAQGMARLEMTRNRFLYHAPKDDRLWVAIWGMIIAFPERERLHALSYAMHDDFDVGLQNFIFGRLQPGGAFVDVGASAGVMTTIGARKVGPAGWVLAVEPWPSLCENIRTNLEHNAPATPFALFEGVALDREATVALDVRDAHSRISTVFAYRDSDFPGAPGRTMAVSAKPLDAIVPEGRRIDLVKIDAEGAELPILRGMARLIAENPAIEIILEWGPSHFQRAGYDAGDVMRWMDDNGFTARLIDPLTGALGAFDPANPAANIHLSRG